MSKYHWRYFSDNTILVLYEHRTAIGKVSFIRDEDNFIKSGCHLAVDGTKITLEEFYKHLSTSPGVSARDFSCLRDIKSGFYMVEGYAPGVDSTITYFFEEDEDKRFHNQNQLELFANLKKTRFSTIERRLAPYNLNQDSYL